MSDHGRAHATLSPSSAERWISCPASVRMIESLERTDDGGSVWAEEGTRAHDLAEIEASLAFGLITEDQYKKRYRHWHNVALSHGDDVEEMERHAATYVDMLQDIAADLGKDGEKVTVRLEIRVQTGVPGCWGTADAVLMTSKKIAVVDYKYGKGVRVAVKRNPQAMLYGVGVLELLNLLGTVEDVVLGICQPRVDHGLTTWELTAESLVAWRDEEAMDAALESGRPDARFGPSEDACRWCPAAGVCKPRMVHITQRDFGNPDLMDADELADAVTRLPELSHWAKAVEAEALKQVYSEGKSLPGLKVVLSGGKRGITDKDAAIETLVAAGYDEDAVTRQPPRDIETLGTLEKVVGKANLPKVLGPLLKKGDGSPSLVPEDDPRDAVSSLTQAATEFEVHDA